MTATNTTTETAEYSRMGRNIAPRVLPFKNRPHPSHDVRLSEVWGCQVTTAHNRRMQVGQWVEDVLLTYREAQDTESMAKLLARIDAALAGQREVPLPDAQYKADHHDAAEDSAQAVWVRDKSDDALDAYITSLSHDLYAGTQLLAQLKAERQHRKDAK